MIILAGFLKTSPDRVDALVAALRSLIEPTLREDGCLDYCMTLENREQGTVLVYERWRDEAALAAHLAQPAITEVLGGWADRIDTSGVRKFDAANERGFLD